MKYRKISLVSQRLNDIRVLNDIRHIVGETIPVKRHKKRNSPSSTTFSWPAHKCRLQSISTFAAFLDSSLHSPHLTRAKPLWRIPVCKNRRVYGRWKDTQYAEIDPELTSNHISPILHPKSKAKDPYFFSQVEQPLNLEGINNEMPEMPVWNVR